MDNVSPTDSKFLELETCVHSFKLTVVVMFNSNEMNLVSKLKVNLLMTVVNLTLHFVSGIPVTLSTNIRSQKEGKIRAKIRQFQP